MAQAFRYGACIECEGVNKRIDIQGCGELGGVKDGGMGAP